MHEHVPARSQRPTRLNPALQANHTGLCIPFRSDDLSLFDAVQVASRVLPKTQRPEERIARQGLTGPPFHLAIRPGGGIHRTARSGAQGCMGGFWETSCRHFYWGVGGAGSLLRTRLRISLLARKIQGKSAILGSPLARMTRNRSDNQSVTATVR